METKRPMKPTFDLKKRPLSWSAISSFEYDPEQWYRRYVLGIKDPSTAPMEFGKEIGEKLATDPSFLPGVPRRSHFEYELRCMFGKIPLIGFIDSYLPHTDLDEYKTGVKPWTQKRVDEHGQLDMYLLMLYLCHQVRPEKIRVRLHWLPTQENGDFSISLVSEDCHSFDTKRTMVDVLHFGDRINSTVKQMREYAKNHA